MDNINTPIGTIQKILGHENRRTTEIYLHSFNETEKQAIRDYELARQNPHTDSHTTKKGTQPDYELSALNYWYTRQDSNL